PFYLEALKGTDDPDPAVRQDTAEAYQQVALVQSGQNQLGAAALNFGRAAALLEGLPEARRALPQGLARPADWYSHPGTMASTAGQRAEAEAHLDRAVALRTRLGLEHPQGAGHRADLAKDYIYLGHLYDLTDRRAEAASAFETAVGLLGPLAREHP